MNIKDHITQFFERTHSLNRISADRKVSGMCAGERRNPGGSRTKCLTGRKKPDFSPVCRVPPATARKLFDLLNFPLY
ncbi:Uncharacterized protein dnm_044450 [Desulfonema magnum]|uniref:Uncharacterized protein n=1 Tax=Desulfonema magnum TaxID=45655 RepID=A0A975BMY2_9BACT|nr:Uncharacterized protein dnm_044450 [Desulfonema magnum]